MPQHFLDIGALDSATLRQILDRGAAYRRAGRPVALSDRPLAGRSLALIFEFPSTRTRLSFEVAMRQLGGEAIFLRPEEMQIGRGETIADTARVLSRYVDAIMIRARKHEVMLELAQCATVPVINGLTNFTHPCQIMADVMTFEQHKGPIAGYTVAWIGDGNNVATSWIEAAVRFDFTLKLACPERYQPPTRVLAWAKTNNGRVTLGTDPDEAVRGADCVVTDAWVSMRDDAKEERQNVLMPYQVNERLMALARPDALFMHCLPAYRGQEVTAGVIDGPRSVVWDEAENRLHAQKGILAWCLS